MIRIVGAASSRDMASPRLEAAPTNMSSYKQEFRMETSTAGRKCVPG